MATYQYDIGVDHDGETSSGSLSITIDTTKTPAQISGTFTPEGGSAVTCSVPTWNTTANGAVVWSFELTSANGDFPIKANGGSFTYRFNGNENSSGTDPSGNVNWPNPNADDDIEETVTWQGEATVDPLARGQGAY